MKLHKFGHTCPEPSNEGESHMVNVERPIHIGRFRTHLFQIYSYWFVLIAFWSINLDKAMPHKDQLLKFKESNPLFVLGIA